MGAFPHPRRRHPARGGHARLAARRALGRDDDRVRVLRALGVVRLLERAARDLVAVADPAGPRRVGARHDRRLAGPRLRRQQSRRVAGLAGVDRAGVPRRRADARHRRRARLPALGRGPLRRDRLHPVARRGAPHARAAGRGPRCRAQDAARPDRPALPLQHAALDQRPHHGGSAGRAADVRAARRLLQDEPAARPAPDDRARRRARAHRRLSRDRAGPPRLPPARSSARSTSRRATRSCRRSCSTRSSRTRSRTASGTCSRAARLSISVAPKRSLPARGADRHPGRARRRRHGRGPAAGTPDARAGAVPQGARRERVRSRPPAQHRHRRRAPERAAPPRHRVRHRRQPRDARARRIFRGRGDAPLPDGATAGASRPSRPWELRA